MLDSSVYLSTLTLTSNYGLFFALPRGIAGIDAKQNYDKNTIGE
jgi:hypothetical protein